VDPDPSRPNVVQVGKKECLKCSLQGWRLLLKPKLSFEGFKESKAFLKKRKKFQL